MAEPTTALTFQDLLLRVAEYYGVASYDSNGMPYIPTDDAFNLRECKRIVNEGIRMFIARPPRNGKWRWTHRTHILTFDSTGGGSDNINSDPARYVLPQHFACPAGSINYAANSSHGITINWCDIDEITQRRELSVRHGYPMFAAIRPYQPASAPSLASSRRWEIIFDPSPNSNKSVEFPYVVGFDNMQLEGGTTDSATATTLVDTTRTEPNDYFNGWVITIISGTGKGSYATVTDFVQSTGTFTVADWLDIEGNAGGTDPGANSIYAIEPASNLHPAGFMFDEAIRTACLAKCEMEAEDAELGTKYIEYFDSVALPQAHQIDANLAPRKLGKMTNGRRQEYIRVRENVNYNTS